MAGRIGMDEKDRFMEKVSKGESGCWLWQAGKLPRGYGLFSFRGRSRLAHRAAYAMFNGPLDKRDVMHSCDNPSCVNPAHLSLGTRVDNMQDAVSKGRTAKGDEHGRAKLSELEAIYAKFMPFDQKTTAEMLGISQGHVSMIRSGKAWAYLPERS